MGRRQRKGSLSPGGEARGRKKKGRGERHHAKRQQNLKRARLAREHECEVPSSNTANLYLFPPGSRVIAAPVGYLLFECRISFNTGLFGAHVQYIITIITMTIILETHYRPVQSVYRISESKGQRPMETERQEGGGAPEGATTTPVPAVPAVPAVPEPLPALSPVACVVSRCLRCPQANRSKPQGCGSEGSLH